MLYETFNLLKESFGLGYFTDNGEAGIDYDEVRSNTW